MARFPIAPSRALLAVLFLLSSGWAAKTVVILNPWRADPALSGSTPQIFGAPNGWNGDAIAANQFQRMSGDLWSFTFASNDPGDFRLLNRGNNGWTEYGAQGSGSTSFNLNTLFATTDTVWILPGATMATPPTLRTSAPPSATLMILNPWEAATPGRAPSVQIESQGWTAAAPVAGQAGWYSSRATLFASLVVGIRNSTATSWIGPAGLAPTASTLALDTAFAKNDTIWIVASPALQILSSAPAPPAPLDTTWLFVFNPWDGVFPLARPVAYLDGAATGTPMEASATHCGWYRLAVFSAKQALFRNSRTGATFGNGGIGSNTPVALASTQDSFWIAATGASVAITRSAPAQRGACSRALLATTVYDVDLQAPGFGELYTGVLRGIVADSLDTDRKPVLAADTGRASGLATWFRDTPGQNASTCRDLVLELDTATGIYRMDDPEFFPIDDFTTVAGGGVNPYNNLLTSSSLAHNYSFCLESHGEFEYKPGQTLEFTGDDDFWYFIDGKLRMDLGGVHVPASGSVSLDTLGLVPGRTIPWDFFFCERMPGGSSLEITTSMNLRTSATYSIADSTASGKRVLRLWASTTQGQGCAAKVVRKSARGQVFLSGGDLASPGLLSTGTHFGGIQVFDSSWQVSLDTSRLQGLAPGSYVLRIRSFDDTTRYRDIAFSIPVPPPPPPPPPPVEHPLVPGTRCDLLSGPVVDTTRCIDIGALDGTTLRVPAATTRISTKGLVLCGAKESKPEGTDIVYIVDQSGSMWNKYILPLATDTIGFYECNGAAFSSTTIGIFRGSNVTVIPRSDSALAMERCNVSGDIYEQRGLVVQEAIRLHSEISPGSQAAWISFGGEFVASGLVDLSDSAAAARLIADVKAARMGGTEYEEPLAWARLLLQGGVRDGDDSLRSGSKNRRKAIIMISDGEPNDAPGYLDALTRDAWAYSADGTEDWTVAGDSAPPIYGFFLSNLARSGGALRTLADRTGGEFHQIPPSRPDSLRKVMTHVLGNIVAAKRPDSLRIVNTANGQISVGIAGGAEGGGFRVTLDSLVGLVPGPNVLELRSVLTGERDSTVTSRWTVVVSDSGSRFTLAGTDSTLMAACTAPSRISLKPANDTTRAYADEQDSILRLSLDVAFDGQLRFPVGFASAVSRDSGLEPLSIAAAPAAARAKSTGRLPWVLKPGSALRGDGIVQTGFGWDTVAVAFHTPRDPRDTATARLPVRHSWPVGIRLSPDTARGTSGSLSVFVHDTNTVSDSVVAVVSHRLGDRLRVVLRRTGPADFAGVFPFRQASAVVAADTILQTGPTRLLPFDSIMASYGEAADTSLLRRPDPSLLFIRADGIPSATLDPIELDVGEGAPIRIGLFLDGVLVVRDDSASIRAPSWLGILDSAGAASIDGIRLRGGLGSIRIRGLRPGSGGSIRFDLSDRIDSLVGSPIAVLPFRILFVDSLGGTNPARSVDRQVRGTELVRLEIHGRNGLCASCSGLLDIAGSDPALMLADSIGAAVAPRVVSGRTSLRIRSDIPLDGASISLSFDSLFASATIAPVRFAAPPPDSVVYGDRDGDGALDHARVFFRIPWNPSNTLSLPWPNAGSFLDLSKATLAPDTDSTTLDVSFTAPQFPGRTAWTSGAVAASWSWSSSRPQASFPAIERIAPIPVRARILRGKTHDTLVVKASEPLQPDLVVADADLLRRLAPGLPRLASGNVSWNAAELSLRLVYASEAIDALVRPADSVRFSPHAAVQDAGGTAPGDTAPAVVVEGIDRAPSSATVSDADADGRADQVVLRFATAPRVVDLFRFRWPDTSGALQERTARPSDARSDSSGRVLTFSVAPFDFGATSCAVPGCADLGSMETHRFGDTLRARYDELDGVVPVIVKAQLRFGKPLGTLDTVRAWLSESVDAAPGAGWLRWGRPGRDSLGDSIPSRGETRPTPRLVEFLVDSTFLATGKDSLRIGAWPSGGVQDPAGNRPGRFAHWAPLELGPIPLRLNARPWPSMARNTGWSVPSGEPPLSLYVRATGADEWRSLDGRRSPSEPSRYTGVLLQSNSDIDDGTLYLYDNLGVAVAKLELAELAQAVRQSRTERTIRGGYQAWIAWNGTTSRGEFAPTGVYIGRLVVWKRQDKELSLVHQVFKLGWQMPTIHSWDENDKPIW